MSVFLLIFFGVLLYLIARKTGSSTCRKASNICMILGIIGSIFNVLAWLFGWRPWRL